jgi:hypothetical protein
MVRHVPCANTLTPSPLWPAMSLVQLDARRVYAQKLTTVMLQLGDVLPQGTQVGSQLSAPNRNHD